VGIDEERLDRRRLAVALAVAATGLLSSFTDTFGDILDML
jgi:hypothetical protein